MHCFVKILLVINEQTSYYITKNIAKFDVPQLCQPFTFTLSHIIVRCCFLATLMLLSTMCFSLPGCWSSLKRVWPPHGFTLTLSTSRRWCYIHRDGGCWRIVVVVVVVLGRTWWSFTPPVLAAPQHHAQIDTRPLASPIPADSAWLCELFLRPPPARGFLLDAGWAIRVIAPLPSIATTALRAADRFERPAAARRKLRPENFARKLLPRVFGSVAGKQTLYTVPPCVFSGESFYFSREVLARVGYWTVSLRIWLGLELDFEGTNWETMNWKGRYDKETFFSNLVANKSKLIKIVLLSQVNSYPIIFLLIHFASFNINKIEIITFLLSQSLLLLFLCNCINNGTKRDLNASYRAI